MIRSAALYGRPNAEPQLVRRHTAMEMWMLRCCLGVSLRDHVPNSVARPNLARKPIAKQVQKACLSWFGHLKRSYPASPLHANASDTLKMVKERSGGKMQIKHRRRCFLRDWHHGSFKTKKRYQICRSCFLRCSYFLVWWRIVIDYVRNDYVEIKAMILRYHCQLTISCCE